METEVLYEGVATNGPYAGETLIGRFPKGILFVDKPSNTCIVYDYSFEEGSYLYRARTEKPVPLRNDPDINRVRAADEFTYDVQAAIEGKPWA